MPVATSKQRGVADAKTELAIQRTTTRLAAAQ
jgi:hypothetical protein